jgi:hypothetical protein
MWWVEPENKSIDADIKNPYFKKWYDIAYTFMSKQSPLYLRDNNVTIIELNDTSNENIIQQCKALNHVRKALEKKDNRGDVYFTLKKTTTYSDYTRTRTRKHISCELSAGMFIY